MNKYIFLVGGTAGTGKTTIAKELVQKYTLDHRIGTGFIREIVKTENPRDIDLAKHTFQGSLDDFVQQSIRIKSAVDSCVLRAQKEGTSLIIEGNHLIPCLFYDINVDAYIILKIDDTQELMHKLYGDTHFKRKINSNEFEKVWKIQEYLISEAEKYSIPVMSATNLRELFERINALARKK